MVLLIVFYTASTSRHYRLQPWRQPRNRPINRTFEIHIPKTRTFDTWGRCTNRYLVHLSIVKMIRACCSVTASRINTSSDGSHTWVTWFASFLFANFIRRCVYMAGIWQRVLNRRRTTIHHSIYYNTKCSTCYYASHNHTCRPENWGGRGNGNWIGKHRNWRGRYWLHRNRKWLQSNRVNLINQIVIHKPINIRSSPFLDWIPTWPSEATGCGFVDAAAQNRWKT
jgi:hypothetical protein